MMAISFEPWKKQKKKKKKDPSTNTCQSFYNYRCAHVYIRTLARSLYLADLGGGRDLVEETESFKCPLSGPANSSCVITSDGSRNYRIIFQKSHWYKMCGRREGFGTA